VTKVNLPVITLIKSLWSFWQLFQMVLLPPIVIP